MYSDEAEVNPFERIASVLSEAQKNENFCVSWYIHEADLVTVCASLPDADTAAEALHRLWYEYPNAFYVLMEEVAKSAVASDRLSRIFLRFIEDYWRPDPISEPHRYKEFLLMVEPILVTAFPMLPNEIQCAAYTLYPGIGSRLQKEELQNLPKVPDLGEYHEFTNTRRSIFFLTFAGQDFPALNTVAGLQARLKYLGYPATDPLGDWNVFSRLAWVLFQLDTMSKNPLGCVEDDDREYLDTCAVFVRVNEDRIRYQPEPRPT